MSPIKCLRLAAELFTNRYDSIAAEMTTAADSLEKQATVRDEIFVVAKSASSNQAWICALSVYKTDLPSSVEWPQFRARLRAGARMPVLGELYPAADLLDTLPNEATPLAAEKRLIDVALAVLEETVAGDNLELAVPRLNRVNEAACAVRAERRRG